MSKIVRYVSCLLLVLSVCTMSVTPVMAQAQPDLQPTQITITTLYAGATNTVTVVVANNGDTAVSSFDVKLEANGVEVATKTGNSILANNDAWYWPASIKFDWTPAASGNYTLRATVDSAGAIAESDETNNQLEQAVTVIDLSAVTVTVRVEGATATIWSGEVTFSTSTITDKQGDTHNVDHPTALGALNEAANAGGFSYVVSSAWGPLGFVEEVAGEANSGMDGWKYRVNWVDAGIAAVDYTLSDGDEVLWYYGTWGGSLALRLTVDKTSLESTDNFTATVEYYNDTTSAWNPLVDATLYVDSRTYTTDANGQVANISLAPGGYTVYADKGDYTQYTRSNKKTVIVYVPFNLQPGWNFISVPKRLASGYSTAQQVFSNVDTAGHSIFAYGASSGWTAMGTSAVVSPLEGIWIYAAAATELHPVFDTNPRQVPPTKQLAAGWNAIGFSDFTATSANSALTSVEANWAILIGFDASTKTYEVSIINNAPAGDPHDEDRQMTCWKGYWLHMTSAGELAGVSS